MNLSQNKNTPKTYQEMLRAKLYNKLAAVAVIGALGGAVYFAPDSHPKPAKNATYQETHTGQNPADIQPDK